MNAGGHVLLGLVSMLAFFYAVFWLQHFEVKDWWVVPTQIICGVATAFFALWFKLSVDEWVKK